MRDIVERTDGLEKLKVASAAIALLIPPLLMVTVARQPQPEMAQATQLAPAEQRLQPQSVEPVTDEPNNLRPSASPDSNTTPRAESAPIRVANWNPDTR